MIDPPIPTPFQQEVVPNPARRAMFWLTITFSIPIVLATATLTRYATTPQYHHGSCDGRSIFHDQWVERCADTLAKIITPTIAVIVAAGFAVLVITFLILFATRDPYRLRLAEPQVANINSLTSPSVPPIHTVRFTGSDWIGGLAVLVTIIGCFLPWASITTVFGEISISGIDGANDGKIVLILGIIAALTTAAFATKRKVGMNILSMLIGIAITAIGIVDTIDIERLAADSDEFALISAGPGLYLVMIGGTMLTLNAARNLLTRNRPKPTDKTETHPI